METVARLPDLPQRRTDGHKGTYGRVLVIAGSRGMSGAAVLCGSAALRGGAGLVKVATSREVWPIVAAGNPCYTTLPLHPDAEGRVTLEALPELLTAANASDVVALGPGLGRSAELTNLIENFLGQATVPIVLDADGLNACADRPRILENHAGPVIVTPHPGEFARLLGQTSTEVQASRQELAVNFAAQHRVVVLLKGPGTIVTDGTRIYVNGTGNPGMATGGTGDVLTGLIAALVGQGLEPFAAAQLGAYLHGLAGDLARDRLGEVGLIATDVLEELPQALSRHRAAIM